MTPKFTAEEFIDAISDEYHNRGERLKHDTIIELKYVQELLGANDEEMYLLLNCIDDRIRLRVNLEEQASQKRFHLMNHPCLPIFLDFYLEFYREPLEGLDYRDKDRFLRLDNSPKSVANKMYELYEDTFPALVSSGFVDERYRELFTKEGEIIHSCVK